MVGMAGGGKALRQNKVLVLGGLGAEQQGGLLLGKGREC